MQGGFILLKCLVLCILVLTAPYQLWLKQNNKNDSPLCQHISSVTVVIEQQFQCEGPNPLQALFMVSTVIRETPVTIQAQQELHRYQV